MSYSHLQTTTGQPAAAGAAGSSRFNRPQRREPTATVVVVAEVEKKRCVRTEPFRKPSRHYQLKHS